MHITVHLLTHSISLCLKKLINFSPNNYHKQVVSKSIRIFIQKHFTGSYQISQTTVHSLWGLLLTHNVWWWKPCGTNYINLLNMTNWNLQACKKKKYTASLVNITKILRTCSSNYLTVYSLPSKYCNLHTLTPQSVIIHTWAILPLPFNAPFRHFTTIFTVTGKTFLRSRDWVTAYVRGTAVLTEALHSSNLQLVVTIRPRAYLFCEQKVFCQLIVSYINFLKTGCSIKNRLTIQPDNYTTLEQHKCPPPPWTLVQKINRLHGEVLHSMVDSGQEMHQFLWTLKAHEQFIPQSHMVWL